MLKKYTKFLDGLESVEKVFLAVTAAIMVIVIAYQVVLRYVFNASNAWSEELARYLFIYDVFIGSAIALRKNSHLQVDVFLNLMKERIKIYLYHRCYNPWYFVLSGIVCIFHFPVQDQCREYYARASGFHGNSLCMYAIRCSADDFDIF